MERGLTNLNILKCIGIHVSEITRRKNVFFPQTGGGGGADQLWKLPQLLMFFFIESFPKPKFKILWKIRLVVAEIFNF